MSMTCGGGMVRVCCLGTPFLASPPAGQLPAALALRGLGGVGEAADQVEAFVELVFGFLEVFVDFVDVAVGGSGPDSVEVSFTERCSSSPE